MTLGKHAALGCVVSVLFEYILSGQGDQQRVQPEEEVKKRLQTNTSNREHIKHWGRDWRRREQVFGEHGLERPRQQWILGEVSGQRWCVPDILTSLVRETEPKQ